MKAGWYPDSSGITRYWDGTQWTSKTAGGPRAMGSGDIAIGILIAVVVLFAVCFGSLNLVGNLNRL